MAAGNTVYFICFLDLLLKLLLLLIVLIFFHCQFLYGQGLY